MQGHLRQSSILAMVAADVGKAPLLKTVTVTTAEEDFHVCISHQHRIMIQSSAFGHLTVAEHLAQTSQS